MMKTLAKVHREKKNTHMILSFLLAVESYAYDAKKRAKTQFCGAQKKKKWLTHVSLFPALVLSPFFTRSKVLSDLRSSRRLHLSNTLSRLITELINITFGRPTGYEAQGVLPDCLLMAFSMMASI